MTAPESTAEWCGTDINTDCTGGRTLRTVLPATVVRCRYPSGALGQEPSAEAGPLKPSPERLKGMKAARADIEKGALKQKHPSLTKPAWVEVYVESLRRLQPSVECEAVEPKEYEDRRAEIDAYNAVMRAEIASRSGRNTREDPIEAAIG